MQKKVKVDDEEIGGDELATLVLLAQLAERELGVSIEFEPDQAGAAS